MIQGHFGLLHRESKPAENIGSVHVVSRQTKRGTISDINQEQHSLCGT